MAPCRVVSIAAYSLILVNLPLACTASITSNTAAPTDATSESLLSTIEKSTVVATTADSSTISMNSLTTTSTESATTLLSTSASSTTTSPVITMSAAIITTTLLKTPVFTNISMVVTLNERETQRKILDTIGCLDQDGGQVKVNLRAVISPTGRCARCFQILPCLSEWCLYYVPNAGTLDIKSDPIYSLTITCASSKGQEVSQILEVRLIPNLPPAFNYSVLSVSITIPNTRNKTRGQKIYTVSASDPDTDQIFYQLVIKPDNGNFQIGDVNGEIRAISDLNRECSLSVTFEVYIKDKWNNRVGPLVIRATLNDSNTAPTITNMDGHVKIREDTRPGKSIYNIHVSDDESIAAISYSLTTLPSQARPLFNITNHEIVLIAQLDYEIPGPSWNWITLKITAFDIGGCSSELKTVIVEVTDVNEPPVVLPMSWIASVYEGWIDFAPPWKVDDPDLNDSVFFSITTVQTAFVIDTTTGTIRSVGDYDVDGKKNPTEVNLTIEVTDRGGLSVDCRLTIKILDTNDNAPMITTAIRSFSVTECAAVGDLINSTALSTYDEDSSFQGNNVVHFIAQRSTYFTVISSGHVVLTSPIRVGEYSSAQVYATDKGLHPGPLTSAPVFIIVRGIPCSTTTSTTPTKPTTATTTSPKTLSTIPQHTPVMGSQANNSLVDDLPWIIISAILACCMLGLQLFMCQRYARPRCLIHKTIRNRLRNSITIKSADGLQSNSSIDVKTPTLPERKVNAQPEEDIRAPTNSKTEGPLEKNPAVVASKYPGTFDFWTTGDRSRGRPKLRFKDICKTSLQDVMISPTNWLKQGDERTEWRAALRRGSASFETDLREKLEERCQRIISSRIGRFSHGRTCASKS